MNYLDVPIIQYDVCLGSLGYFRPPHVKKHYFFHLTLPVPGAKFFVLRPWAALLKLKSQSVHSWAPYKSQRSLRQGQGMLRVLLFWCGFFKQHHYLRCCTRCAARNACNVFDALAKNTGSISVLNIRRNTSKFELCRFQCQKKTPKKRKKCKNTRPFFINFGVVGALQIRLSQNTKCAFFGSPWASSWVGSATLYIYIYTYIIYIYI